MPSGDGTGPVGMGPMTGRSAGYCAGYGMPGFMNAPGQVAWGMGGGGGRGRGRRGWRHSFYATGLPFWARTPVPQSPAPERGSSQTQTEVLKAQAEQMEKRAQELRQRIEELESTGGKES